MIDKRLAATHPGIADQVQFERLSESLASDPSLEPLLPPRVRARQALAGVGDELLGEAVAENAIRNAIAPQLFGGPSEDLS